MIASTTQPMTKIDAIIAFAVTFLIQFAFAVNDVIQDLALTSELAPVLILVVKQAFASLVITLLFYGYNRKTTKPATPIEG